MNDLTTGENSLSNNFFTFSSEEIGLIKSQICKPKDREATDVELKFFVSVAQQAGLNPFHKQIYAVFRKSKNHQTGKWEETMSIQTGIDGLRLVANRTGVYAGCDPANFEYMNTDTRKAQPRVCVFTVYKIVQGHRVPFTAEASWDEFYPGDNPKGAMWRKMPRVMLSKVAEARALRMAFPMELSGLYAKEEMHKAENEGIEEETLYNTAVTKDYGKQEKLLNEIAAELGDLTQGMDVREKAAYLMDQCHVQKFPDLKQKSMGELEEILANLKSNTIEVENG
tara:strand:+ start:39536 stop:40381 length:846 start_codon:yes stop_codon:yes gene_type:complete